VSQSTIECTEAAGKTVHRLRLIELDNGGQEISLEFTDGTNFSMSIEPSTKRSAYLYRQTLGSPEIIRSYDE
jgi:hypothetical protein